MHSTLRRWSVAAVALVALSAARIAAAQPDGAGKTPAAPATKPAAKKTTLPDDKLPPEPPPDPPRKRRHTKNKAAQKAAEKPAEPPREPAGQPAQLRTSLQPPTGEAGSSPLVPSIPNSEAGASELPKVKSGKKEGLFNQILRRVEFHGYARIPLSVKLGSGSGAQGAGTDGPRTPFLVDSNYFLSGFAYTRLHETDWAQAFISINGKNVSVEIGMYAALISDWAEFQVDRQWGIAQASVTWHAEFSGLLKRLYIRGGIFWDALGYIQPYDTYIFGRTHAGGIKIVAEFPWVELGFGAMAHLALPKQQQGFTPVFYGTVNIKPPRMPWRLGFYAVHEFTRDKPPLSNAEDASLSVVGVQFDARIPYLEGPLRIIPWAYYRVDNAVFLTNAIEILHSFGGKGLMDNFLGDRSGSENGDGEFPWVAAIDFPMMIWRGRPNWKVFNGPLRVRFFGMATYVKSPQQDPDNRANNRHKRLYLKWGIEPEYGIFPWLRFSVRYDRVILDMDDQENGFRVISPKLTFRIFNGGEIHGMISRYFYGNKVELRPGQVVGGITRPDDLVFKLQAQAYW
ncbi:MAG: hypothetical protein KC503_34925 [Myxococcales bacterium]|nr:hypothetical protein [Myxococcales bacterium]